VDDSACDANRATCICMWCGGSCVSQWGLQWHACFVCVHLWPSVSKHPAAAWYAVVHKARGGTQCLRDAPTPYDCLCMRDWCHRTGLFYLGVLNNLCILDQHSGPNNQRPSISAVACCGFCSAPAPAACPLDLLLLQHSSISAVPDLGVQGLNSQHSCGLAHVQTAG
jgi:hypothetical protein